MSAADNSLDQPVFAPAIAAALVAIGALSLLFYVVFAAYAPDLSGENDGRPNALSRSAVGFAALDEFLSAQGVPVLISRGVSAAEFAKASLIVLTPSMENTKNEVLAVSGSEPKLIILPKWLVTPDPLRPGWVGKIGLENESKIVERLLEPLAPSSKLLRRGGTAPASLHNGTTDAGMKTGPIESLQAITGPKWIGYVTDQEGRAVVSRLVGSQIYVLADPDLLNTRGLHDLDTARTAAAIIQGLRVNNGPVILDVTLSGYRRSPNILRLIFEPPLLGATLCALLVALLLGIHAAMRFGPAQKPDRIFAFGKQALADNSAALISMLHREHRMAPRYAAAMRRRVARAVGIPTAQQGDAFNALLEELHPEMVGRQTLSEILAEAAAAQNESDALKAARKIYRWRAETIDEC